MKILVVDDNADDRKLLRYNLEKHCNGTVLEALDGREGLDMARAHQPDLIISDALMPRMDGFEFLRAVKLDSQLSSVPFVFHSAVYTGVKDKELALSLGAEAFIAKPMEPEKLWDELAAILQHHEICKENPAVDGVMAEEQEYLRKYSGVVAAKLEEKVRELEETLAERKRAEEALRTQFTQFSTIFDALNALVYVADMANGTILFMNRYGTVLFGESWQGKECREVFQAYHGDYCGTCPNELLVQDGAPLQSYVWEFHSSTNGRWYQGIDRAIPWTDGRLVRLHIAFDITERKEIEHIKDGMISAVSHEMRTPLTALMGYAELMLSSDLSVPQTREYLKVMQREAGRLNELIGNFLDIQMQKVRQNTVGFRPVQIDTLIGQQSISCGAASGNHRITVDCAPDLPPVLGDETLLNRMIEMLVSNAVKFSPKGGEVRLEAFMNDGSLTIVVRDQGIGIPVEELGRVFELFYRLDNTDRRMFGGIGLGLALVKEIALGHGGRVWAESSIGKGSAFYVSLPVFTERSGQE
jgi:signal transduction histidine kinase/CheY-like chemotaxis protein